MVRNLLLGLAFCAFLVPAAHGQEWARAMFSATNHDFGTLARGSKAEFHFEVVNKYLEDVHISSVRSSCGCTTPTITKDTLKTWEKGSILAVFNTRSFLGQRSATITVTIDKPFFAEVQLNVHGFIRSDVVFTPGAVEFGTVNFGEETIRQVQVTYAGRDTWKIQDVRSASTHLEVKLNETARGGGRVNYDMTVRLKPDAPAGYLSEELTLLTNDDRNTALTVPVEGVVVSPITVSPASLFLGVLAPGQKVTKQLVVRGNKPFKIVEVHCADSGFEFGSSLESKKLHFIPVTFTAGDQLGKVAQTIRIATDLGADCNCVATATIQAAAEEP